MKFLTDANLLLALASAKHEHNSRAEAWFRQRNSEEVVLTRVTQMSFLRLISNPKIMQQDVLSVEAAWSVYQQLKSDWRVIFLQEPVGIEFQWLDLLREHKAGHNTWTDAYIAAFAAGYELRVATFDRGFSKWSRLPIEVP